jgi:hypothetical protein
VIGKLQMKTFMQYLIENEVVDYLSKLKVMGYKLMAHQTHRHIADGIIKQGFGGDTGVAGTSLFVSPEGVQQAMEAMREKQSGNRVGSGSNLIHGGSDSIVLMAVPGVIQGTRVKGLDDIDYYLGELDLGMKVPNENIIGYATSDGDMVRNPNFDPEKSRLK